MRKPYEDAMTNALSKMFKQNRDFITEEIFKQQGPDARSTDYRRDGLMQFGALQMIGLSGEDYWAVGGDSGGSVEVGI